MHESRIMKGVINGLTLSSNLPTRAHVRNQLFSFIMSIVSIGSKPKQMWALINSNGHNFIDSMIRGDD